MDHGTLQYFRKRLEEERVQLLESRTEHTARATEAGEREVMDRGEEAEQRSEFATQDALAESEENLLKKIDLALQLISEGTYGMCVDCEQPIPRSRLEAKPSVSLCVKCQEDKETELRRAAT